ncbi:universal stress protein [Verrucomicrobiota bacterium sgz303538]
MSTAQIESPRDKAVEALHLAPIPLRLKTILVPTDFSEPSYNALNHALGLAGQFGSSVLLVHVIEPVHPYPVNGLTHYPGDLPSDSLYELRDEAEKTLVRLRDAASAALDAPVQVSLRVGRATDEIVLAAKELEADLIVIATHGYTGLKHVFLGSTAERVVRHAPCPVLVLRSRKEPPPTD